MEESVRASLTSAAHFLFALPNLASPSMVVAEAGRRVVVWQCVQLCAVVIGVEECVLQAVGELRREPSQAVRQAVCGLPRS